MKSYLMTVDLPNVRDVILDEYVMKHEDSEKLKSFLMNADIPNERDSTNNKPGTKHPDDNTPNEQNRYLMTEWIPKGRVNAMTSLRIGNNVNKNMKIYNGNIKGVSIASWNHRRGLINNGTKTSKIIEVEEYMRKNDIKIMTLIETDLTPYIQEPPKERDILLMISLIY